MVTHEFSVLHGQERLEEIGRDVGVLHEGALFAAVLLKDLPIACVDARHDAWRHELEALHLRHIPGDHQARRDPQSEPRPQKNQGDP